LIQDVSKGQDSCNISGV